MSRPELEELQQNDSDDRQPAASSPVEQASSVKELPPVEQAGAENQAAAGNLSLQRVRVRWAKREALRYTGHLDMHLVWERTLRRAGLPLAYTKGFRPNPRLHLAAALPLGFLSRSEITDFWLEQDEPPALDALALDALASQIQTAAPPGLEILQVESVPLREPALQIQVQSADYIATALDTLNPIGLAQSVEALLSAPSIMRHRGGKKHHGQPYDLRPLIERLEISAAEPPALHMRLAAREGATGRPEEVLQAMGQDPASYRVERLALILASDCEIEYAAE